MLVLAFRAMQSAAFQLSPSYDTAINFISVAHRTSYLTYFENRYNVTPTSSTNHYQEINFDYDNGIQTSVRWEVVTNTEFETYLHSEYLHAYDAERQTSYFYFIVNRRVLRDDVIEYVLELDIFTTYTPHISFARPLFVERQHCIRFKTLSGPTSLMIDKQALLPDELDSQFEANIVSDLTTREIRYFPKSDTNATTTATNTAINKNLWLYVWMLPKDDDSPTTTIKSIPYATDDRETSTGLQLFVAPFNTASLFVNNASGSPNTLWNATRLYEIALNNDYNARVVAIRVSPFAPFNWAMHRVNTGAGNNYVLGGNATTGQLQLTYTNASYTNDWEFGTPIANQLGIGGTTTSDWCEASSSGDDNVLVYVKYLCSNNQSGTTLTDVIGTSTFSQLSPVTRPTTSTLKSADLEPKLYSIPYRSFNIQTKFSQPKPYNKLKLQQHVQVKIVDTPLAHEHKYQYYLVPLDSNSQVKSELETNRGLVDRNAYELLTKKDTYADYVANHSNHMMSGLILPMAQPMAQALFASVLGAKAPLAIALAGIGSISTGLNYHFTMEDLKASPDTIKNTGNNILHDINSGNIHLGLITYDLVLSPEHRKQVFDYYYTYGYKVNQYSYWQLSSASGGVQKYESIFTRSRFNYIKTNDNEIKDNIGSSVVMNKTIKTKFQEILNRGIRLIQSEATGSATIANFNLEYENPEIIL